MGIFQRMARALAGPKPSRAPSARSLPRFTPLQELTVTELNVERVRVMLRAHEQGDFTLSGAVATHVLRDADLYGALLQRVTGLLGLPLVIEPAQHRASRQALTLAEELEVLWPRMVSRAAMSDIICDAVLLGFAVGQIVWDWDDDRGELVPRLEPWPATHVQYHPYDRTWWAIAHEGLVQITPGDGTWFLYTPMSAAHPQMWGALRCTAEWFLRAQNAATSATQYANVRGQGVWIAEVPATAQNDPQTRRWLQSIKNLGRNGLIPAPQTTDKAGSFNVRVEEAKGNSFEIFDLLLRVSGARFRLAILGQNLTANNDDHATHASGKTGNDIRSDVKEADGETSGDAIYQQLLRPWARYQTGRADLAPWGGWDTEPESDRAEDATTLATVGGSFATWRTELATRGRLIDVVAAAERFGMPLLEEGAEPTAPAPAAPPEPADEGDGAEVIDLKPRRFRARGARLRRIA